MALCNKEVKKVEIVKPNEINLLNLTEEEQNNIYYVDVNCLGNAELSKIKYARLEDLNRINKGEIPIMRVTIE